MKGFKPSRANMKECQFRVQLLNYCRESFEQLLNSPLTEQQKEGEKEEDRLDREFKTKHKLFGNIDFVGEIYKKSLLSETILQSVFHSLLGFSTSSDATVNDNTIDAAIKLISKLGFTLEQKIADSKADKRPKLQQQLDEIFARFKELQEMAPEDPRNRASVRVKFLIKNMFDNKSKNWEKTKSEDTQVKKKAEIANQVTKKAEEKRKMEMG